MNDDQNQQEAIFEQALKCPTPRARAAFLDDACRSHPELRARLDLLLEGHFMGQGFLEGAEDMRPIPADEQVGAMIGRYKLLERIGEGGFGVVYLAEQREPVKRRVALKIIKPGMDTKQVVARFEAERQALALMDHPGIARVFDGGATDSGRPYFVMELVRGVPITVYCDEHQLSASERLRLFAQVCEAVQHAHQKGIIHRDLKPSNILVTVNDGRAVPKVIDFGVAKATQQELTEKTIFTQFHHFIGTPAYVSPEQAQLTSLDIDTRSDIYALGVLLYELLTGKTPFDGKELLASGLDEMRRTIREVEPVKPSTRLTQDLVAAPRQSAADSRAENGGALPRRRYGETQDLIHALRGDLDWIVMKCLEKDRTRRYATANGLATDIARHLNNEPIAARPPSRLYRFQKSIQRNKLAFGAATAVALTLVIGFAVSTAMYFKAQGEKKRAQIEAAKAYGVAQFFKDMVDATAPNLVHGRDITPLRDMLNRTADRISRDLNAQPEVEVDVRRTLGVAYQILRQYPQAEGMYRQGLAVARKHFGNEHSEVAKSLNDLGFIVTQRDEFEEAEKLFREALEIHRKLRRKVDSDLAFSLNGLGIVLKGQGKLMEAETLFRQALEMRRKLFGNDNHMTSNAIGNLAGALAAQGQLAEAEALYRETIAIARNHHEGDHDTPPKLKGLAELLQKTGRLAEAEGLLREALRMERNLFGEGHPSVAKTLDRLVALLKEEGKEAEARALFESQTNLATDKKSEPR